MFSEISSVPASLVEFYATETRSEQVFESDGLTPVMVSEIVKFPDENGEIQASTKLTPKFFDVDYVVQIERGESKSFDDVWQVVNHHKGDDDEAIKSFLIMVCNTKQWEFHDKHLTWYKAHLSLEEIVLPKPKKGEPDPLIAHKERIAAHQALKPTKPQKIDIKRWFLDNALLLRSYAFLPKEKQLEMLFDDQINGTTTFADHNRAVKAQYPKG